MCFAFEQMPPYLICLMLYCSTECLILLRFRCCAQLIHCSALNLLFIFTATFMIPPYNAQEATLNIYILALYEFYKLFSRMLVNCLASQTSNDNCRLVGYGNYI